MIRSRRCHMCGGMVPDTLGQLYGCPTMCADCQALYAVGGCQRFEYRPIWKDLLGFLLLMGVLLMGVLLLMATMLSVVLYFARGCL